MTAIAGLWALIGSLLVAPGDAARHTRGAQNDFVVGAILDLASGWTSLGRASHVTLRLAAADANTEIGRAHV